MFILNNCYWDHLYRFRYEVTTCTITYMSADTTSKCDYFEGDYYLLISTYAIDYLYYYLYFHSYVFLRLLLRFNYYDDHHNFHHNCFLNYCRYDYSS